MSRFLLLAVAPLIIGAAPFHAGTAPAKTVVASVR